MGLLQSWELGNKLPYSTVLGAGSNMLDALLRACQVGEEQPGAFLPQSIPSRAGRRRMQLVPWQDRWADEGCSAAAPRQGSHPGPPHTHLEGSSACSWGRAACGLHPDLAGEGLEPRQNLTLTPLSPQH